MLNIRTAALAVMATTALAGNVLNELPDCWDSCSNFVGGDGCSWFDASCICDLANSSNYLSATIQCAKSTCKSNWDSSDIDRFLAPIEFTCSLVGGIVQGALNGAASAASVATAASTSSSPSSPTTKTQQTTQAAETTLKATIVQSSSTAVVDQPLSYGSNGVSSGAQSTSILVSTIDIVPVPVSTTSEAAGTTTAGGIVQATGSLTSTPSFAPESTSDTTSSSAAATSTSEPGGGGTLFDSTSDGSSNSLAGVVIAAYVVAVAIIHAL